MAYLAAEGEKIKKNKKKKKVGKPIGDPVRGRDAPISVAYKCVFCKAFEETSQVEGSLQY